MKEHSEIYNDKKKLSEYKKWLERLPSKFIEIECDRKDLVKQGQEQSMFITGPVGVGKTVLMAGVAREILKVNFEKYYEKEIKRGFASIGDPYYGIKWISYPNFIMYLQNSFREGSESNPYDSAEYVATYPGTLCIDDLGVEKMTEFVQQITYYIINEREQEVLHTLITSNFSLQQIANQINPRISSRIGGMCKIVKLAGKDRRLEKKY